MNKCNTKPSVFILDVDCVLTTGHFIYSSEGKVMKFFGKDDSDGLNLLKQKMQIKLVSVNKNGFNISKKRAEDMNI
jgi:3-deoxy-D-manno-octulosonate 8-phosphate phosphatase KdsC-like HAD superfamily phosphatase